MRGKDKIKRKVWTDHENAYLRRAYPDRRTSELAAALGRGISSVYAQAAKLGLAKSAGYLACHCRLQRGARIGKAFEFKPGQTPPNKGLRRPGWSAGRMRETQFLKGQRPTNHVPVGTIRANGDGYLRVKVADVPESIAGKGAKSTNWEFVHRRVWEAAHGPIPKGHRLWWKDGNHLNCSLENLELLTDKESMARTTIHNLPPGLKEVIRLTANIDRRIRRIEKDAEK